MTARPFVPEEMRAAATAALEAVRQAGGVFLTEDAAKGLAEAALVAAEPWLRCLTLRQAGEAMAQESSDPAVTKLARVWIKQAEEYRTELEKKR